MQRLRVGVTGLAAILLVVLLATAIASGVRHKAGDEMAVTAPPPLTATVGASNTVDPNTVDPNAEPLAQLGAAPGGTTDSQPVAKPPAR